MGNIPQTLKFIQVSSVCVLHTISLRMAKNIKKPAHLYKSLSQPFSSNFNDLLKNTLRKFLFKRIFPVISNIAKRIFITVGFRYIKIGLSKKMVSHPKIVTKTAPIKGTYGIFFSNMYITQIAINVAIIRGGIATNKSFPLL